MKNKYFRLLIMGCVVILLTLALSSNAQEDMASGEGFLPAPTGPYNVGQTSRHWVDENRDETFTDDPSDHRELMIRIWYPVDSVDGAMPSVYLPNFSGSGGKEALGVWPLGKWRRVEWQDPITQEIIHRETHSFLDVSVSNNQLSYPILIFSPGLWTFPEEYTTQIEELASYGYIVVGIYHPYVSGVTLFPDGRIVAAEDFTNVDIKGPKAKICAQDILFIIDQLEIVNQHDPQGMFTGRFDLDRIGAVGHSMGGWVVALAGSLDSRIRAVINEDGPMVPTDYDPDLLVQPFMFFSARAGNFPSSGPRYSAVVSDFEHGSFMDIPVWPITLPDIGRAPGNRTVEIVRVYVLAFFDQYLKGEPQSLLRGRSEDDYPEVIVASRDALSPDELQEIALEILEEAADNEATELDLSNLGLNTLPPQIGQLTNLQNLILSDNNLTTLPPEIGQLINLQELSLGSNQLTDLPAEIGQLTNLQTLVLSNNDLTTLPPEIGQLINLQKLFLTENNFQVLPSGITSLASLQKLFLNDNQLTVLAPEIDQILNLQTLNVANNNLTHLPQELCGLEMLDRLIVFNNPLSSDSPTDAEQLTAWCASR